METPLRVAIRLRPLRPSEGGSAWDCCDEDGTVRMAETGGESLVPGRTAFRYDAVYGENVDTRRVYDGVCRDLVRHDVLANGDARAARGSGD